MARVVLSITVLLLAGPAPGVAQRVVFQPGNIVRVARVDTGPSLWIAGTVLTATRIGLLVHPTDLAIDTLAVPLNGTARIQIQHRPMRRVAVGGGVGMALGVMLGATVLGSVFDASWGDPGRTGEVVGFGLIGGLVGAGVGAMARPKVWRDVPVTAGGLVMTPLDRPVEPGPLSRREYWREFPSTDEDFGAFFGYWQDSLDSIEGVWEEEPLGTISLRRVAIVRDRRYRGWDYVAVRMPRARGVATREESQGLIEMVLQAADRPGGWAVAYPTRGVADVHRYDAEAEAGVMTIRLPNGRIERWVKLERGIR